MPFVDSPRPTTDAVGERLAKFARQLPHRFMAYDHYEGGKQLLDHRQTKREPKIQPDSVADDLGGEPVTGIAGANSCRHPTRLPTSMREHKRRAAKLTVPSRELAATATSPL